MSPTPHTPQGRLDVQSYDLLVALVCRGPHRALYGVGKPPIYVLSDRHLAGIEDQPAVSVGHGFRELLRHHRPCLAVKVAVFGTLGRVHEILTDSSAIRRSVDASLAVASLPVHRYRPSRLSSSLGSTPRAFASLRMVLVRASDSPVGEVRHTGKLPLGEDPILPQALRFLHV